MTSLKLNTLAVAAVVLISGTASAQKSPLRATLAGEWDGALALDAGTHPLAFIFNVSDTTLTGYVNDGGQSFGNMDDLKTAGDTVRFTVQGLAFTGVVSGRTLNIDLIVFNGSHRKFSATKVDDKAKPEGDDISRE